MSPAYSVHMAWKRFCSAVDKAENGIASIPDLVGTQVPISIPISLKEGVPSSVLEAILQNCAAWDHAVSVSLWKEFRVLLTRTINPSTPLEIQKAVISLVLVASKVCTLSKYPYY